MFLKFILFLGLFVVVCQSNPVDQGSDNDNDENLDFYFEKQILPETINMATDDELVMLLAMVQNQLDYVLSMKCDACFEVGIFTLFFF